MRKTVEHRCLGDVTMRRKHSRTTPQSTTWKIPETAPDGDGVLDVIESTVGRSGARSTSGKHSEVSGPWIGTKRALVQSSCTDTGAFYDSEVTSRLLEDRPRRLVKFERPREQPAALDFGVGSSVLTRCFESFERSSLTRSSAALFLRLLISGKTY